MRKTNRINKKKRKRTTQRTRKKTRNFSMININTKRGRKSSKNKSSKNKSSKNKSSKNNDSKNLKTLKKLENKLEKLYINNGPTKEIDKTSKKIEDLINKMKSKQKDRNSKKSKKKSKKKHIKSGYSKNLQYNPYPE